MPEVDIRKTLEELLKEDKILKRDRSDLIHFEQEQFVNEDKAFLNEIRQSVPQTRIEEIAEIVGKRFGNVISKPHLLGTMNTIHVVIDPGIRGWKLRLKGFTKPEYILQNLQHAEFLFSTNESGYSATIGYGPDNEAPLYLVMIEGSKTALESLKKEGVPDKGMPKTLKEIIDLFGQYGFSKKHLGPTEYIPKHLELVKTRLLDVISKGKFLPNNENNEERKQYWASEISKVIDHIKTKAYTREEPSTFVVSDASMENLVSLVNGSEKPYWAFIDQGYVIEQLDNWRVAQQIADDDKNAQWFGRIEFNLGQLIYSILRNENIPDYTEPFSEVIFELIHNKKLKGTGREVPEPHNPALSHCYFYLGVLSHQIAEMAKNGENAEKIDGAKNYIYNIMQTHPYRLNRKHLGVGKSFSI